jgi:hypothetical protein
MRVADQSGSPRALAVPAPVPAYNIACFLDKSVGSAFSARIANALPVRKASA